MFETDKIKIELTITENLPSIIQIEKDNSDFIGQYDLDRHKKIISDDNECHYSIFNKLDDSLVGHIILAGLLEPDESIEFRRIVVSEKGFGFGREAIKLTKDLCFNHYKKNRLWLDVLTDNQRAINLYESEGFIKERLLRDCIKQNDKFKSIWIMSISSDDFNAQTYET